MKDGSVAAVAKGTNCFGSFRAFGLRVKSHMLCAQASGVCGTAGAGASAAMALAETERTIARTRDLSFMTTSLRRCENGYCLLFL